LKKKPRIAGSLRGASGKASGGQKGHKGGTLRQVSDCVAPHTWMLFPAGWSEAGDWPDLAASAAPSPLLVQFLLDDELFTLEGMRNADLRLAAAYARANAPEAYRGEFYPGPSAVRECDSCTISRPFALCEVSADGYPQTINRPSLRGCCGVVERAKELEPNSTPMVERVRNTDVGHPDKWRAP
jgi:hypothetical protein